MKTRALLLLAAALLCACSRREPAAPRQPSAPERAKTTVAPPAAETRYGPLMRAVYGDRYRADKDDAVAPMPDAEEPGKRWPQVLSAVESTTLSSGETVLVVAGEHVDEHGNADSSHADPGFLSLYLLRQDNGRWQVLRRHENIAQLGSHGSVGRLSWVQLGPGRTGLAAQHGGTFQGTTYTELSLFDPAADRIVDLTGHGIFIEYDDEGGCGESRERCRSVKASWRLDATAPAGTYYDLVLAMRGTERVARPGAVEAGAREGADDIERDETSLQGTARYGVTDGQYRLREGSNIVDADPAG